MHTYAYVSLRKLSRTETLRMSETMYIVVHLMNYV
jgi:hypothetical protein